LAREIRARMWRKDRYEKADSAGMRGEEHDLGLVSECLKNKNADFP